MRRKTIDGNDPIASYLELQEAMEYVRKERKPFLARGERLAAVRPLVARRAPTS